MPEAPSFQELLQQLQEQYEEEQAKGVRLRQEIADLRREFHESPCKNDKDAGGNGVHEYCSVSNLADPTRRRPDLQKIPDEPLPDYHGSAQFAKQKPAQMMEPPRPQEPGPVKQPSRLARLKDRPSEYTLRKDWTEIPDGTKSDVAASVCPSMFVQSPDKNQKEKIETTHRPKGFCNRMVMTPHDNQRVVWDLSGMVLLIYDTVMIPLSPFDPAPNPFTTAMEWVTLVFWTGDMVASLLTAYIDKGQVVMDLRRIRWHYCKTWFPLDVIVVGPDWVFTIMELASGGQSSDFGQYGKLLRTFRIIRCARLLRLAKLQNLLQYVMDTVSSEYLFVMVQITKLLVILLFVNHFFAAAWYQIGKFGSELNEKSWIDEYEVRTLTLGYRYATSLHWAITQSTPGSMEVQPQNLVERIFAIVVLLFGLVYFSSFISGITAAVTSLRSLNDSSKQIWLLRKYLRQHHVSQDLMYRALRYSDHVVAQKKDAVPESRVLMLQQLSQQLRLELTKEVTFSSLKAHPFLEALLVCDNPRVKIIVHNLCDEVMEPVTYAQGDIVFPLPGMGASHMFIVSTGTFMYSERGDTVISSQDWMCEQTIWTDWQHKGHATVGEEGQLISIHALRFADVIKKDHDMHKVSKEYGRHFLQWLNHESPDDVDDIFVHDEAKQRITDFTRQAWEEGAELQDSSSPVTSPASKRFSYIM